VRALSSIVLRWHKSLSEQLPTGSASESHETRTGSLGGLSLSLNMSQLSSVSFAFNSRIFEPQRCSRNLKRICQIFRALDHLSTNLELLAFGATIDDHIDD